MQQDKLDEVNELAVSALHKDFGVLKEHAEHFVNESLLKKVEEDEAMVLSEDEERMLREYRRFITRSKPGAIFKWQTSEDNTKLVLPEEPCLIQDPRSCC
jgi:hypothetical protein